MDRSNAIVVAACVLVNLASFIYVDMHSGPSSGFVLVLVIVVLGPAALMYISVSRTPRHSSLIWTCSILSILSALLFTRLFATDHDPSRVFMIAPHVVLSWVFAAITLLGAKGAAPRR